MRFADIEACNGNLSADNFVTKSEWQAIYSSLHSMRVGQAALNMASPQTVNNQLDIQQNNTEDILIAVQHYNYQQYKTNAHTNGDVIISNDRIYDVTGRNPYDIKPLFAITPLKQQIQGNTFTFQLPTNLLYSNYNTSISQIQIDYDNGQGYQTISQNQKKSISYTTGGEKEIKVKFIYSNGSTFESHSKIWLNYVASSQNTQARFNGFGTDILWSNNPITGNAYNGSSATGRVTIELAPGHTQLTKPLIVIEGFDPENSFNYIDLINDDGPGGLNIQISQTGEPFLTLNQAIEDEDYDLVFVDFVNSTDFIQRNAYMVEEVIRQINQLKAASGSTEKNVVLGMSMGGLVGRYALRHMEIEGETHDTKLYISHDTPHQGANVPLAAQALVRHLVGEEISLPVFFSLFNVNILDLEDNVDGLSEGLALLQSPAAQQMLVYQLQGTGDGVSVNNNTLYSSFLNEYKSMGYPQQNGIRNIAIANGTECGNPLDFNPYDHIVNTNIEVDLPFFLTNIALAIVNGVSRNPLKFISSLLSTNTDLKAQFTLRALPSLQNKQIYKGRIYIKKTILFLVTVHEPLIDEETVNSSSNMLALDNANGGVYDIENFAELPAEFEQHVLQRRFNFIPAYSSLDVGAGNVTINSSDIENAYSPLSPPLAPKNIPFDNFFINPISSEQHIQFTLNNGQWLIDELRGNEAFYSCATSCTSELPLIIDGPDQVCETETFSLLNLYSGSEINWSVEPPSAVSNMTSQGHNVTITSSNLINNNVILKASIPTDCGEKIITKKIHLGARRPQLFNLSGEEVMYVNGCTQIHYHPTFNSPPGALDWEWRKISGNFSLLNISNNQATIYSNQPTNGIFDVRVKDACGWSQRTMIILNINDCSNHTYTVYPNPATDILNITSSNTQSNYTIHSTNHQTDTTSSTLYDFNGNPIKSISPATGVMSLEGLNPGRYILIVYFENETESHHIIIE